MYVNSLAMKKKKKARIEEEKKQKKKRAEDKKSLKKRTGSNGYYANLRTQLHGYVKHVLRKGEPCYTCGKPQSHGDSGQAFHVGHFIPAGSTDPRRFMLENLRMQCYSCNSHHSGMRMEYRRHMIREMGIDHVQWLECDDNHQRLKDAYPDIEDIRAETARYRKLWVNGVEQ